MAPDPLKEGPPGRVLFHVHTRFSKDAWIRAEDIVVFARAHDIAVVVVTDHDTHLGAAACARAAGEQGPRFPLAAEYRSSVGDMVALYLSSPLTSRDPYEMISETHDQGGLILIPHPFKGPPIPEGVLEKSDLIEVFNARCTGEANARAAETARRLGKPGIAGADAHFVSELGLAINTYDRGAGGTWRDVIGTRAPSLEATSTTRRAIRQSQLLKYTRQGRAIKAIGQVVRLLQTPADSTPEERS